jgi:cell division protease FtsH
MTDSCPMKEPSTPTHRPPSHPLPPSRARLRGRLAIALVALAAVLGVVALLRVALPHSQVQTLGYTELLARAAAGDVSHAEVDGERVLLKMKSGAQATSVVSNAHSQHALVAALADHDVPVDFVAHDGLVERLISNFLPLIMLLSLGSAGALVYRRKRLSHVKHANAASVPTGISFADVAGVDEAKEGLQETIEFLRNPTKFGRLGGRAPRGILLSGPPGTGKTLLARAAASEARVPFLSAGGASFQEMFAGVGASRVRSLFAEARKVAPCVVFIDEIDALGRKRGRGEDSASADADQMLNQLLTEMDGFEQSVGIVVLASTNRPDVLDPALLRPGRFDRQITVPHPDVRGREQILGIHAKKIVLSPAVALTDVARSTTGYSGADLAQLLNEAAIIATREGAQAVSHAHIEHARDKVTMGEERKTLSMEPEERYATAVHEAGHVAVGLASKFGDPVTKVSILPRGRALGVTQMVPERDRLMYRREFLEDRVAMLLGGRAAEQVILGTMTAGASDDIERAVSLARRMVGEMGMSSLGPVHAGEDPSRTSQATLDRIERAASRLVRKQLARACAIVAAERAGIDKLVAELLERDTLSGAEIRACFSRPNLDVGTVNVDAANLDTLNVN